MDFDSVIHRKGKQRAVINAETLDTITKQLYRFQAYLTRKESMRRKKK